MESKTETFEKGQTIYTTEPGSLARALLNSGIYPVMLIDENARVLEVNGCLMELCGMKSRKFKNTGLLHYFTDDRTIREHLQSLLMNGEEPPEFLAALKRRPAGTVETLVKLMAVQDEQGTNFGILLLRDVSGEKQSEEQTSQLAAIVTSSNDAIVSTTPEGYIKVWNRSATNIYGYTEEEALGQHISLIVPAELLEDEQDVLERIRRGEQISQYDTLRQRKDGRIINISLVLSPVIDGSGQLRGISSIARETTDLKKSGKELSEARRSAERDRERAEDAMRAKQQFLTNMSHEIRTPLNAIIGFTRVLLKTRLDDKQKEYLNAIKISGDALIVLINDILDLGKAESGKMIFENIPFKPADSVSDMLKLFQTRLAKRKVKLTSNVDPRIPEVLLGDPARLHQIILNLVGNAVKFTSRGEIAVSMNLLEESASEVKVLFAVSDTGIGIAESELETIFENFSQTLSGTARLYGGTGLGLAIVKQLVSNLGGSVSVKSIPGEGSTFTVNLAFKKTSEQPQPAEIPVEEAQADENTIRILVAEDVTLNQLLMKTILQSFGFEWEIAANGKITIEKLKTKKYDLVLMDLHMPEMNGYEATRYIRNELQLNIPVIALTADVTTADVEKCMAAGMNDYVPKPIDEKLLYSKITHHVDKPIPALILPMEEPLNRMPQRVINLDFIRQHSGGRRDIAGEMVQAYIRETPELISKMKQSINNMDWGSLENAAHTIIPSFRIVGLNQEFEEMAKKIKEHAAKKEESLLINGLVARLEEICMQAIKELETEMDRL